MKLFQEDFDISGCTNLQQLCDYLNEIAGELEGYPYALDMDHLPTYGGEPPELREGIFSWDETHYLVGESRKPDVFWKLVERKSWEDEMWVDM